jgi:hypothetical protein
MIASRGLCGGLLTAAARSFTLVIEAIGVAGETAEVPAGWPQSASDPGSIAVGGTWPLESRYDLRRAV